MPGQRVEGANLVLVDRSPLSPGENSSERSTGGAPLLTWPQDCRARVGAGGGREVLTQLAPGFQGVNGVLLPLPWHFRLGAEKSW